MLKVCVEWVLCYFCQLLIVVDTNVFIDDVKLLTKIIDKNLPGYYWRYYFSLKLFHGSLDLGF